LSQGNAEHQELKFCTTVHTPAHAPHTRRHDWCKEVFFFFNCFTLCESSSKEASPQTQCVGN
jgi:hypothetical protein